MISVNDLKSMPLSKIKRLSRKYEESQQKSMPSVTGAYFPQTRLAHDLLQEAERCWDSFAPMRKKRWRNRRFYRGDQWGDYIVVNGETMTEEEYIQRQGKVPLKNNLVRPPVRNIIGQFRQSQYKSIVVPRNRDDQQAGEMMTVALEGVHELNNCRERNARLLEEFLVGADAIVFTHHKYDEEKKCSYPHIESISLENFFQTPHNTDVCNNGVDFIGDFYDTSIDAIVAEYTNEENGSIEAQEQELKAIYAGYDKVKFYGADANSPRQQSSFLIPDTNDKCRVFRLHRLEGKYKVFAHDRLDGSYNIYDVSDISKIEANNLARKKMSELNNVDVPLIEYEKKYFRVWMYYHLSPNGHILWMSENPYEHNSHPYIVKLYPRLDGESWSMIEDLLDQQKMINRMFILQDFILSASAKGVLLVPEDCIPDDGTIEEIAEEYTKYNGVVKIKLKPGMQYPQQVVNNNVPVGLPDMISRQIQLIDVVGGIHGALQGKTAVSGTSNALYQQETNNAQLNILDYLESFFSFLNDVDYKVVQLILQYYTTSQYIPLMGKSTYDISAQYYNPEKVAGIKFFTTIQRVNDIGTLRQYMEEQLGKLLQSQLITLDMYLENSNLPFSDKLLRQVKAARQQAEQQGSVNPQELSAIGAGVNNEMAQAGIQANPDAANRLINNRPL